MKPMIAGIALTFFCLISGACSEQKDTASLIAPEKMKVVLWEYLQIQHFAQVVLGRDSTVNDTFAFVKLRDSLFTRHRIDPRSFELTMLHYRTHPDEFLPLLDSVAAYEKTIKKPERSPNHLELDVFLDSLNLR